MRRSTFSLFGWIALTASAVFAQATPENVEFFEKKVRPVLVNRCYSCHSADTQPLGDLRVDDRNGLLVGGESGPAVVPGHPEKSLLLQRLRHADAKRKMPKSGDPVTDAELADLALWIKNGVAWPAEVIPVSLLAPRAVNERLKAKHWAWQPISTPKIPSVIKSNWVSSDIDRFVLAKLEEKKLNPVRDADRATLLRRLKFDLTGLPPTPAEVAEFLGDPSKDAYPKLVDRLLASPAFGERWGRHWLDVARYAESSGPSRNMPYPHAWKYRDYVIDAVNRDVPFDRFVQEQIAGDLLPAANNAERDRLQIATGYLALGPKDVNQRFRERFLMDNVDEKIDTVSRSILGLTVSCARCHDHKFDPIPTADYYSMAGIFASTYDAAGVRSKMGGAGFDYYKPNFLITLASYVPRATTAEIEKIKEELDQAQKAWEEIRGTPAGLKPGADGRPAQRAYKLKVDDLQEKYFKMADPAWHGYAAHGVREAEQVADTEIRIRGQAERLGPVVPRGFLTAFAVPGAKPVNRAQSGRLELAQWLTSAKNPMTPRVIVNRIWRNLFGQGIVTTVDNFGFTGDRPSHPELLDHLASQFVRENWSVKGLVRRLVLSRTYRLSSESSTAGKEFDPANRLAWRHSPRRLDAEEIRDAMLASAGVLEPKPETGSLAMKLNIVELRDDGPQAQALADLAESSQVRSIYLPLLRGLTPKPLEAFDPVTQTLVTGQRDSTTVPTQALFLLNSAFVRRQSLELADKLLAEANATTAKRIEQVYQLTLGRKPTQREAARAAQFLANYADAYSTTSAAEPVKSTALAKPEREKAALQLLLAPNVGQDQDRVSAAVVEEIIEAGNPKAAAWMALVQAIYGSAEFRFVL